MLIGPLQGQDGALVVVETPHVVAASVVVLGVKQSAEAEEERGGSEEEERGGSEEEREGSENRVCFIAAFMLQVTQTPPPPPPPQKKNLIV